MPRALLPAVLALSALTAAAQAAPRVATDTPAVRSLAAQVMAGAGEPEPILPAGASPHAYALRPSEARTLQEAEVVFWVGPSLTPWLAEAVDTLAADARAVALEDAPGVTRLPAREDPLFAPAGAAEGEPAHDHDHDHGHDHEAEHAHGAEDDHAHDHAGGLDPHLWLDPANAAAWARAMAETLAEVDPENAALYRANAEETAASLDALTAEIEATVAPVRGQPYLVFHDAYRYFEEAFDIPALGAVRLSDATEPGAARVAALRDRIAEAGVACVFAEPQFPPALLDVLTEGVEAEAATLDPVGATLEPGPDLYGELLRGLARDLAACLR